MTDTVRLGRIRGIPIGVNWSLLVIVALFAAGLAANRFPYDAPGYSATAYALAGAVTAVALLLTVLLHELGHAVVARRAGLTVDGITLSWMGGITRIEGDAKRPGSELAIAGVGPLVSLAAGGLCWMGWALAVHAGVTGLAVSALGWLGVVNMVLAVFNLIPASPLDGGKVLHAAVWAATGDRWKASRAASKAGIGLGVLVVAIGSYEVLSRRNAISGIFLMVLGWWLVAAARDEEQGANVRHALDGLAVSDLMRPVASAPGWITLDAFVERYASARPGWVWLLEQWNGGYSGVIPGEVVFTVPRPQWSTLRPADLAVPANSAAAARPDEPLVEALARTNGRQLLLAVYDAHTVGAVLPSDVEALVRYGRRPAPYGAYGPPGAYGGATVPGAAGAGQGR